MREREKLSSTIHIAIKFYVCNYYIKLFLFSTTLTTYPSYDSLLSFFLDSHFHSEGGCKRYCMQKTVEVHRINRKMSVCMSNQICLLSFVYLFIQTLFISTTLRFTVNGEKGGKKGLR